MPFREATKPSGSITSPSWKTPGFNGYTAEETSWVVPFTAISATAILPASILRPARLLAFFFPRLSEGIEICLVSCIGRSDFQIGRKWLELKGRQVPTDQLASRQQAHHPAEGEKGAEWDGALAGRGAFPRDQEKADEGAREESYEDRRGHVAAEIEPHQRRELDVAETHPPRVGEGDQEEGTSSREGGSGALGQAGRVADESQRHPRHCSHEQDP